MKHVGTVTVIKLWILTSRSHLSRIAFDSGSLYLDAAAHPTEVPKKVVSGWWNQNEACLTETSVREQDFGFRVRTSRKERGKHAQVWSELQPSGGRIKNISCFWVKFYIYTRALTLTLFFSFILNFAHILTPSSGKSSSYIMPITTPGWASHASISTSAS